MRELFEEEESEAVLLVDAANAFNNISIVKLSFKTLLYRQNLQNMLTTVADYPFRLFVIGDKSCEGITQGDLPGI